ncbi:alanine racemase [Flavimobilis sp. GY10621]|uniref:Alanine racemase n=1 Tax=Flavimobilis rhizosphaerae TaxID=2775421 RepID=A0ABR9DLV3_9MICO|nr:alanine racemase [Flavimobilis rhizosphaerae]MBD9698121.1 alanine racemase [Flavimobilis rhizosphaerae]
MSSLRSRLDAATSHLPAPLAVVDLDVLEANADDLVRRAGGTPVRLASKSVRVRALLDHVLARPGWAGIMAFSLAEALWLVEEGHGDVLLGYPVVDRTALAALAASPAARAAVTLMVDDVAQARRASEALAATGGPDVRVCLDVDASWRPGVGRLRVHLGTRRSPLHEVGDVVRVARAVDGLPGLVVGGLMFYEAQVAGLPDSSAAVRLVKARSVADLDRRRGVVRAAVEDVLGRGLDLVNSGGSGSLGTSSADPTVTEVTAGSGLYVPGLFDGYRSFEPRPSAFFALDVVRRPAPSLATLFGGGYIASGPPGHAREPRLALPAGLRLTGSEGAGEVQTPVRLPRGTDVRIGDRVWLRHAKAGELMERFGVVHLVRGERVEASVPTYRGEGRTFG